MFVVLRVSVDCRSAFVEFQSDFNLEYCGSDEMRAPMLPAASNRRVCDAIESPSSHA